jgi:hypothetical protein
MSNDQTASTIEVSKVMKPMNMDGNFRVNQEIQKAAAMRGKVPD